MSAEDHELAFAILKKIAGYCFSNQNIEQPSIITLRNSGIITSSEANLLDHQRWHLEIADDHSVSLRRSNEPDGDELLIITRKEEM